LIIFSSEERRKGGKKGRRKGGKEGGREEGGKGEGREGERGREKYPYSLFIIEVKRLESITMSQFPALKKKIKYQTNFTYNKLLISTIQSI
jgi:hypothetical protein